MFPMSATVPTSSSSRSVPPVPPPIEIPREPDPDPTFTASAPLEAIAETKSDESNTSPQPASHPQSLEGLPSLSTKVESHTSDPAPAPRSVIGDPHATLSASPIQGDRPLPPLPANVIPSPHTQPDRPWRRFRPPPAHPLGIPGSGVYRQAPVTHPSEFERNNEPPPRIPFQVRPLVDCCVMQIPYELVPEHPRLPSRLIGRPVGPYVGRSIEIAKDFIIAGYVTLPRPCYTHLFTYTPPSAQLSGSRI